VSDDASVVLHARLLLAVIALGGAKAAAAKTGLQRRHLERLRERHLTEGWLHFLEARLLARPRTFYVPPLPAQWWIRGDVA
jgi:hypothetical protein